MDRDIYDIYHYKAELMRVHLKDLMLCKPNKLKSKLSGDIRVIKVNNQLYAFGTDVADSLGYSRPSKALIDNLHKRYRIVVNLNRLNWKNINEYDLKYFRNVTNTTSLNEIGLRCLIIASKKPMAKNLQKWIMNKLDNLL